MIYKLILEYFFFHIHYLISKVLWKNTYYSHEEISLFILICSKLAYILLLLNLLKLNFFAWLIISIVSFIVIGYFDYSLLLRKKETVLNVLEKYSTENLLQRIVGILLSFGFLLVSFLLMVYLLNK